MAPTVGNTLRRTWWMPLLCYGLALWLTRTEAMQLAEARTLDWRTRYRALFQPPPDPRIVIALFEDGTEAHLAPWPVDRAWHGQLNRFLAAEKVAVVSWDVILDTRREGEGDTAMARATRLALQSGTRVVTGASTSRMDVEIVPGAQSLTRPLTNIEGDRRLVHGTDHALLPFPELRAASWWGGVDVIRGADGIVREVPLIFRIGDEHFPTLALQTLLVYLQVPPAGVRVRLGDAVYFRSEERHWRIPVDHAGRFLLNYRYDQADGHPDFPTYSYLDLLRRINDSRIEPRPGAAPPPDLAGKIVFVGQTVTGKADAGPTPRGAFSPLVLVHANLLSNLLAGDYARRAPGWLVWSLALAMGYGGIVLLARRSVPLLCGSAVLGVVGYVAVAIGLWIYGSWWLPVAGPLLGFTGLQFMVVARRLREEQRARQEIKNLFGTYVSPDLVERLVKSGQPPRLGGSEEEITAYFSDIQDFSSLAESLPPDRLVALMNEYLTACTDILQEEGGTLDKFVGDAVIVMFGAPVALPDHARRACIAALRVQQRLDRLRHQWQSEGAKWPPAVAAMRMRIGLNTGRCVVGNMGSRTRFNYTMMGDDVNLAARLESGARHWGVYTLCSESAKTACEQHGGHEVVFRSLGRIVVKGRTQPVAIHEIVGLKNDLPPGTRECLDLFARGLARFQERDWAGARECFERSAGLEPHLPGRDAGVASNPSLVYLELVTEYSLRPPPPDWAGIFVMKEK